jgi:hypothetical protein
MRLVTLVLKKIVRLLVGTACPTAGGVPPEQVSVRFETSSESPSARAAAGAATLVEQASGGVEAAAPPAEQAQTIETIQAVNRAPLPDLRPPPRRISPNPVDIA